MHTEDFRLFTDPARTPFLQIHIVSVGQPETIVNRLSKSAYHDKDGSNLVGYECVTMKSIPGRARVKPQSPIGQPSYDLRQESGSETYMVLRRLKLYPISFVRAKRLRRRYMDFYKTQITPGRRLTWATGDPTRALKPR